MDAGMLAAAGHALAEIMVPLRLLYLFSGVVLGLVIGILPGVGGVAGMALLLPFTYSMDPYTAFAFLLGLGAVTSTGDTIPAVLFGVPGTSASQATVLDGHAMAKKGEAGRALSAAYVASVIGGVFGALLLGLTLPLLRPVILFMGSPELLGFFRLRHFHGCRPVRQFALPRPRHGGLRRHAVHDRRRSSARHPALDHGHPLSLRRPPPPAGGARHLCHARTVRSRHPPRCDCLDQQIQRQGRHAEGRRRRVAQLVAGAPLRGARRGRRCHSRPRLRGHRLVRLRPRHPHGKGRGPDLRHRRRPRRRSPRRAPTTPRRAALWCRPSHSAFPAAPRWPSCWAPSSFRAWCRART